MGVVVVDGRTVAVAPRPQRHAGGPGPGERVPAIRWPVAREGRRRRPRETDLRTERAHHHRRVDHRAAGGHPAAVSDVAGDAVVAGWGPSSGVWLSGLLVRDAGWHGPARVRHDRPGRAL